MSATAQFTPLYGTKDPNSSFAPHCYLLQIDRCNILLDCGWVEPFDPAQIDSLRVIAPTIHAVLISHASLSHLGALPYARAKWNLRAPIYSTLPVWRLGQLVLYDTHQAISSTSPFSHFTLDDVDATFENFVQLKYQQQIQINTSSSTTDPNDSSISITAFPAAHSLGGAIWKIKKDSEEIIYAIDFNHRKERHLNPTVLQTLTRPSYLFFSTCHALTKNPGPGRSEIIASALRTLSKGGNVLIPCDTATRVIELALSFEEEWISQNIISFDVVVLNHVAYNTFEFAKSMIEWMSDSISNKFDMTRENPFEFKRVNLCHTLEELNQIVFPKVVMTSFPSLQFGFSRDLFVKWCSDPNNAVFFLDPPAADTLARKVLDVASQPYRMDPRLYPQIRTRQLSDPHLPIQDSIIDNNTKPKTSTTTNDVIATNNINNATAIQDKVIHLGGKRFRISLNNRKPLEGFELVEWKEMQRRKEAAQVAASNRAGNTLSDPGSSDSDSDMEGDINLRNDLKFDLNTSHPSAADHRLGMPPKMFPYMERTSKWDDYGEIVDMRQFMIGEDPGIQDFEDGDGMEVDNNEMLHFKRKAPDGQWEEEEIPSKFVVETFVIDVRCSVQLFDFSGLSDGRSLRQLLSAVSPRRLITINGTDEEMSNIVEYAMKQLHLKEDEVLSPKIMETVGITSDTSVYRIVLGDSLMSGAKWNRIENCEVMYVAGEIRLSQNKLGVVLEKQQESKDDEKANTGHPSVFIGDLKLAELKESVKQKLGLKAEFLGGALCIENPESGALIVVKRVGGGEVVVDGALCEEYFLIRDLVYGQYLIL